MTLSRFLVALTVTGSLLFAACSEESTENCESAALDQVLAEIRFGDLAAAHDIAHESGAEHDDGELVGARVEMILATFETEQRCG